jgi:VanZ family protein
MEGITLLKIFLSLVTFLIVYGSLYPFHIALSSYELSQWHALLNFDITQSGRGDTVANILLFVPFGFLCVHSYPVRNRVLRFVHIMLAGLILAFGLQAAQLVIPGRVSSGSDAVWNMLGCLIGFNLALLPLMNLLPKSKDPARLPPIPLVLALFCIAYSWAPFVPSFDFQLLKDNVKLIFSPDISPWWLFQKFTLWLVIFRFLRSSDTWLGNERLYPLTLVVVLSVSLLIVGHAPGAENILGGVLALMAWYFLRPLRQASILAVLFALSLLITTFIPFELRQDPNSFSWVPFSGALSSNILLNAMSIFRKLAYYGSLIWLLTEAGLHLRTSTVIVAVVLFFSEQLQVFFVGPSPEITDAVMAVAIGVILSRYQIIRRSELIGNRVVDSELKK